MRSTPLGGTTVEGVMRTQSRPAVVGTATVILRRHPTDAMQEGKGFTIDANLISVGNESFDTVDAGRRTLPVLEVFDPDKPFK